MIELTAETASPDSGVAASLTARGDLDQDAAEDFLTAFRAALPDLFTDGGRVLVDCAQVRSCDYTGLSALLMARREAAEIGAQLILVRQSRQLAELLSVAGVSDLLSQPDPPALDTGAVSADTGSEQAPVALDWAGAVPVITLTGQIDLDSYEEVTAAFTAAAQGAIDPGRGDGRTVVDISRLTFADSTILNVLLKARAASDLWLVGPLHTQVHLLFHVTDLLDAFQFADNLGEAIGTWDGSS